MSKLARDVLEQIAAEEAERIRAGLHESIRVAVVLIDPEHREMTLATDDKSLGTVAALREAARSLEEAIELGEARR